MKCEICKGKCKTSVDFWASKTDMAGLLFISIILAIPIWAFSSFLNGFVFDLFRTVGERDNENIIIGMIKIEVALQGLIFLYFYYLGFIKYGKYVAKVMSYFLNFKLKITKACRSCGNLRVVCDLPNEPSA